MHTYNLGDPSYLASLDLNRITASSIWLNRFSAKHCLAKTESLYAYYSRTGV